MHRLSRAAESCQKSRFKKWLHRHQHELPPAAWPAAPMSAVVRERQGGWEGRGGEGMGEEEGEERCQKFTHAQDIIFCRGPELPVHGKI